MIKWCKSSKLIKAEKLINEGKELEIINEEDFMKMLKNEIEENKKSDSKSNGFRFQ